jgi:hypothetical protein
MIETSLSYTLTAVIKEQDIEWRSSSEVSKNVPALYHTLNFSGGQSLRTLRYLLMREISDTDI